MSDNQQLEAFRAEARSWIEANFPKSLAGRAGQVMSAEFIESGEQDALDWATGKTGGSKPAG